MLIAGLDEAGRGPVIGSLCVGCVIIDEKDLYKLDDAGVDDSKKLTPKKRKYLSEIIKDIVIEWKVFEITAEQLNKLHDIGLTLNKIEERSFAKLLNSMKNRPEKIFLDAADVKEERFGISIGKLLDFKPKDIISKHGGDAIFTVVGAASILAKTHRDQIIEDYKEKYGPIGSGYPSDPNTRKFLKDYYRKNRNFPPIIRTFWSTVEKIKQEVDAKRNQKKISDF